MGGFKRALRRSLDAIAGRTGVLAHCRRRMRNGLTILTYHRVLPDEQAMSYPHPALAMTVSAFAEQISWLADHFTVLPVMEALKRNADPHRPARPLAALTFDDGYADSAEIVAPILEEADIRGTFFVITGCVETGAVPWYDRATSLWQREGRLKLLSRAETSGAAESTRGVESLHDWLEFLKRNTPTARARILDREDDENHLDDVRSQSCRMMTVDQVRGLHARGHEIGSHTVSHPLLPQLDEPEMGYDLQRSREALQDWLGAPIPGFCYPNGAHDSRVMQAVKQAGYAYACTTRPGMVLPGDDRYALTRRDITLHRTALPSGGPDALAFAAEVCGFHEGLRWAP